MKVRTLQYDQKRVVIIYSINMSFGRLLHNNILIGCIGIYFAFFLMQI